MTKKKKSILSDQRFIVLLVIIVLFAIFSFKSREFRQYTTILSMLDFSYYDLLMAIGVTFPLITGGVDLSIGTGMVCYPRCRIPVQCHSLAGTYTGGRMVPFNL